MKMKKLILVSLMFVLVFGVFAAACSSGEDTTPEDPGTTTPTTPAVEEPTDAESIEGEITFIHHRTDINDSVIRDQYIPAFNEIYPNVTVKLETMTDYIGQIKIRMNTEDYGDVLMIPGDLPAPDLPHFFEPLGDEVAMGEEYLFMHERAYDGVAYGIPIVINAEGILYNKVVFEDAGITSTPGSPEE